MELVTNATMERIKTAIQQRNQKLRDIADLFHMSSWDSVQLDVKSGNASKYAIGSELVTSYTSGIDGTTYEFPWIVLDNDRECTWEDGSVHSGLWLGAKYSTDAAITFDASEGIVATESTAQANTYYCGVNGSTYTMLNLSVGDTIPYGSYNSVLKGSINHAGAYKDGYNRYRDSAVRQWLNSSASAGGWWSAKHLGDNAPAELSAISGFMLMLDPEFVAIINPVKIQTMANAATDANAKDIIYDRFFLQSLEEVYGEPQTANEEGPYFPYWKTATGLNVPSNGSASNVNSARLIYRVNNHSTSSSPHLRSANKNTAYNVWGMYPDGYISNNVARHSRHVLVGCVIS